MRDVFNSWLAVLGIVVLAVLIVAVERQVRRSSAHSSMPHRQARVAANEALRRRLASKFVVPVVERKQELERIRE
jgi:hypothetical protein